MPTFLNAHSQLCCLISSNALVITYLPTQQVLLRARGEDGKHAVADVEDIQCTFERRGWLSATARPHAQIWREVDIANVLDTK